MTNTEVVTEIITMAADFMTYMLPIIGVLAGLQFILSWLFEILFGAGRRTFRG